MSPRKATAPCGTKAAYQRHLKHGEQACDACLKAVRDLTRAQRAAKSAAKRQQREVS